MPRYINWYDLEIKLDTAVKKKLITRQEFNSVLAERNRMTDHNGTLIPFSLDLKELDWLYDPEDLEDPELLAEYNQMKTCREALLKLGYKGKTLEVYNSW